jgi:O-antigen chain-terminating methyltransferase
LGFNVEGIDISGEQVERAVAAGLEVYEADAFRHLSDHEGQYDGVVAVDFLEHFNRDELLRMLASVRGALRPGGMLLIQTPNGEGLFAQQIIYGDLTHLTILNARSLEQALKPTGFTDIAIREAGPAAIDLRGAARKIIWRTVRAGGKLLRSAEGGRRASVLTGNMVAVARRC